MTTATEIEPTAVHAPGTEVAAYSPPVLEEYRARFVMAPEEAAALDEQLRNCMRAVLREGSDYGTIPGMGDKPSLFKPGAEKLLQWFGFGFENVRDEIERDADGNRVGVTYKCTVFKELADGRRVTVATCEGYTGYDEDKFFTSAETAQAKAEANERKWARKDKRDPNPSKWENAAEYRAPWNSLLKMAQKRALVGAAIDATAAAGLFTQDLEDMRDTGPDGAAWAAAAGAAVKALPDEVRAEAGRWYRAQGWPEPSQWTPEQWCTALRESGSIAARMLAQPSGEKTAEAGPQQGDVAPREPGHVSRPERQEPAAKLSDEADADAQAYADQAQQARTVTEIEQINKKAREAGKIGAIIKAPGSGNPGKLAVYLDWRRRQLAEADKAVQELNAAANAIGMDIVALDAFVKEVTGSDLESASTPQLRQATANLRGRAA